MSNKRTRAEAGMDSAPEGPFQAMFETFRAELDDHHERRERVIKASRDVTAASKKVYVLIFLEIIPAAGANTV